MQLDFICPSSIMLTWMEEFPSATPVDMPPLDNHAPLLAAIYRGQGEYEFKEVEFLDVGHHANNFFDKAGDCFTSKAHNFSQGSSGRHVNTELYIIVVGS